MKEPEPTAAFDWKTISPCIENIEKSQYKNEIKTAWKWIKAQHSRVILGESKIEVMSKKKIFILGLKEALSYQITKKEIKSSWKAIKEKCELCIFCPDIEPEDVFAIGYLVGKGEIKIEYNRGRGKK